jgi:hypothetical protein
MWRGFHIILVMRPAAASRRLVAPLIAGAVWTSLAFVALYGAIGFARSMPQVAYPCFSLLGVLFIAAAIWDMRLRRRLRDVATGARGAVISKLVVTTNTNQIVRGNASRAIRVLGSLFVVAFAVYALATRLFVKKTTEVDMALEVALMVFVALLVPGIGVAAMCTVARVHDGKLEFFFFGIRTKSFPLDGGTMFDLHKAGRVEMVRILREHRSYVPSGAIDREALVDLLRRNGVREREAN